MKVKRGAPDTAEDAGRSGSRSQGTAKRLVHSDRPSIPVKVKSGGKLREGARPAGLEVATNDPTVEEQGRAPRKVIGPGEQKHYDSDHRSRLKIRRKQGRDTSSYGGTSISNLFTRK